jgi:outer membrane protein TolC
LACSWLRRSGGWPRRARGIAAEHLKLAQARFRTGAVVKADVLSAEVNLARLTQEEMTAAS